MQTDMQVAHTNLAEILTCQQYVPSIPALRNTFLIWNQTPTFTVSPKHVFQPKGSLLAVLADKQVTPLPSTLSLTYLENSHSVSLPQHILSASMHSSTLVLQYPVVFG